MAAAAPVIRRLDEHVFRNSPKRAVFFHFVRYFVWRLSSPTLFLDDFWENLYKPIALIERDRKSVV